MDFKDFEKLIEQNREDSSSVTIFQKDQLIEKLWHTLCVIRATLQQSDHEICKKILDFINSGK